jgi:glyoxylate reductase
MHMSDGPPVLVTRRLPATVMERLAGACDLTVWEGDGAMPRDRLLTAVSGKLGLLTLLTERVDDELLDAAGPQLRVVANFAVGYDNIDVPACTRHGVVATNTPDVLTETTADMAWALLMAASRRVAEGDRFLRARTPWIWAPEMMLGQDIHGKILGVVGFGRIGRAVARRASGFGMTVLFHDPLVTDDTGGATSVPMDELLARSDFVSVHCALSDATRHLIGRETLRRMKRTAVLVNTSRGPVVDEEALAEALEVGEIFAAGLDVFEREPAVNERLLDNPRVVLAPHLGSATVETRLAMGMLAVDNLLAALEGRRPPSLLNAEAWPAHPQDEPSLTGR